MKSYKDLDIYKESFDLAVRIYHLSMNVDSNWKSGPPTT